jgi:DNA-binding transcriptional MerR regulator
MDSFESTPSSCDLEDCADWFEPAISASPALPSSAESTSPECTDSISEIVLTRGDVDVECSGDESTEIVTCDDSALPNSSVEDDELKMAELTGDLKYPNDITECPICKAEYTEPRVLSCIHTFCLKCLEDWAEMKQEEQKLGCPLCRKEIAVPEGGLAELPRNGFIQKLLDMKDLSTALTRAEILCDVCGNDRGNRAAAGAKKTKPKSEKELEDEAGAEKATVYCVQCRTKMCEQCCGCHQKFRFNSSHTLIELEREMRADELLLQFPESTCDKHRDKNLEIYCNECKIAVCMMCYIKSHKSHECADVKEVAEELGKRMKADGDGIERKAAECKEMLEKLSEEEKQFVALVDETEKEILDKCEEMKKLIEDHKSKLIEELSAAKRRQVKQVAIVRNEVERRLMMLGNFKKYSDELHEKGTACDIAKAATNVRERAKELLEFDIYYDLDADRTSANVKFTSGEPIEDMEKLFGKLTVDVTLEGINFLRCTTPIHVIPSKGSVAGIASLGDELFVIRYSTYIIDVYESATFTVKRTITVSGLSNTNTPRGLVHVRLTIVCMFLIRITIIFTGQM